MIIKLLLGQRRQSYPGQFEPEVLFSTTMEAYEEDSTLYQTNIETAEEEIRDGAGQTGAIELIAEVDVELKDEDIKSLFETRKIEGKIINRHE